jgi:putative transport protein
MLVWMEQFLVRYPELALFLVLAAGYWIGSFKIGAVSLGPVTGALFAGLLVGQFAHVPVSAMTKSFLFLLFLFGIGYSVGPQFILALKRDGLKPVLLAVVVCITGLAASVLVAKVLRLDPGFAAGLMSGALTQSAAMGTATDAVNGLALPEADRALFAAHIAVADAVCYIFGYAGVIIFCTVVVPRLLKIDLKTEALKLEQALGMNRGKPGLASAWRKFELRAYRLADGSPLAGIAVAAAEARILSTACSSTDSVAENAFSRRRPTSRSRRGMWLRSPARARLSLSRLEIVPRRSKIVSFSMFRSQWPTFS